MAQLDGTKWKVENRKDAVTVEVKEQKQSVSIYKCEGCVVTVVGKCTNISIDNCKKTGIIFDDVIATVDVVNSQSVQLQANGAIPSISVDKTNGATIYIQSEAGKKVEIITSGASEINVVTPGKTENDDPREQPIPQQFISTFDASGKLITKATEHVGV